MMFKKDYRSGAIDKPDERDFSADHILGVGKGDIPKKVDLMKKAKFTSKNQGNEPYCTAFAVTHIHEIMNRIEHPERDVIFNALKQWENQEVYPATTSKKGDYLRSALKSLKKFGLGHNGQTYQIEGYARVYPKDFRRRIAQGFPIFTVLPTTKTNWGKAAKTGLWPGVDGSIIDYHAVEMGAYNDDTRRLKSGNSWGKTWGFHKDGSFEISYDELEHIGSSFIIYDKKDIEYIYKDVTTKSPYAKEIKRVLDAGLMQGYKTDDPEHDLPTDRLFRPDKLLTRAEMAVLLDRILKLINK